MSLPCGCLVGFYETYNGPVIAIIDARGAGCEQLAHRVDSEIPREMVGALQRRDADRLQAH